jgi:hypothetical protein
MMNTFELFKKLLATLMLVGMMTVFVTGCSSTDDPASDDSASGGSSSEESGACAALPDCNTVSEADKPECELQHQSLCNDI